MLDFPSFRPDRTPRASEDIFVLPSVARVDAESAHTKRHDNLLRTARPKGWRAALEEAFGDTGHLDYATDSRRLGFLSLLPLAPDQAVLEIGSSLGQIAEAIAGSVATLDALEVVEAQARFSAERFRQQGIGNVRVTAGGADCRLPYADAAFDGVVLNLVLEWCGLDAADHDAAQRRLLGEIARVLKPGGWAFIQTKNRYALRLLIGGRDEHMGDMRFGSALPRWMVRQRGEGRGRLYSYPALRAMLRQAGFDRIEGYWAAPEMRRPERLVPLNAGTVAAFRKKAGLAIGETRKTRLLMALIPAALVRYVTPGLSFLVYRSA